MLPGSAIDVLALLFIAVLLVAALEPFIGWTRGRVRIARGLTILVVYAVFSAIVAVFAFLVLPAALTQAEDVETGAVADLLSPAAWHRTAGPPAPTSSSTFTRGTARQTAASDRPTMTLALRLLDPESDVFDEESVPAATTTFGD